MLSTLLNAIFVLDLNVLFCANSTSSAKH